MPQVSFGWNLIDYVRTGESKFFLFQKDAPPVTTHSQPTKQPPAKKMTPSHVSFGWSLIDYVRTNDSKFFMFQKEEVMVASDPQLEKNIKRYNNHQGSKRALSMHLAERIRSDVEKKTLVLSSKANGQRIALEMTEPPKRHTDDITTQESIRVAQQIVTNPEFVPDKDGIFPLPRRVYTDGQPIGSMTFMKPGTKRPVEAIAKPGQSSKRVVQMRSFPDNIKTFQDLLDSRKEFWREDKGLGREGAFFPRDYISSRHVAALLWQPYHEKQRICCNALTGNCRAQVEPTLKHPLAPTVAAMSYLSPLHRDALLENEPVSDYYIDPLCIFCSRYQILHQVLSDVCGIEDAIVEEIPSYYYCVGRVGEYDQSGCIQEHTTKTNKSVRGILGPVVTYNVDYFRPVVGIIGDNGWDITTTLPVEEYKDKADEYKNHKVAYGWEETGPFYRLNHNALPVIDQVDPYERRYTLIKNGPFSPRCVLQGYYRQRAIASNTYFGHLFEDLRTALKDENFFDRPCPLLSQQNINEMVRMNYIIDLNASHLLDKYFPWRYVCMHQATNAPDRRTHRVYYTFLMIVNHLKYLLETLKQVPDTIKKKLTLQLKSYNLMTAYFNSTRNLSDEALAELVWYEPLQSMVSRLFSIYPRTKKVDCRIDDYEYLEYEVRTIKRSKPDELLRELYSQPLSLPHTEATLNDAKNFDHLFNDIRGAKTGAYTNATAHFQKFYRQMRKFTYVKWPSNSISMFTPVGSQPVDDNTPELLRRASLLKQASILISNMTNAFLEVLFLLRMENERYRSLLTYLKYVLLPFDQVVSWIKDIIIPEKSASVLFKMIGVTNFNHLLDDGFTTSSEGINGSHWLNNIYLLTALVRVHILEQIYQLESPLRTEHRNLLILLRNSHIALVSTVCERGPLYPVRDDAFLTQTAALPRAISTRIYGSETSPAMSLLHAVWPIPSRELNEGSLPNIGSSMLYLNFFDSEENAKEPFPFQQLFKHRANLKCAAFFKVSEVFVRDPKPTPDTPFQNYVLNVLELSWKGLWRHCTVSPSFKCSRQLDSIFRNTDRADVRAVLQTLFNTYEKHGDDKIRADMLVNSSIMEAIYRHCKSCTPIITLLDRVYRTNIFHRSVAHMELIRTVLNEEETLDLRRLYTITQRISLKYTEKISARKKHSFIEIICNIIKAADEQRYLSKKTFSAKEQLNRQQQHLIEAIIKKLNPRGILYAEDLQLTGMTEATIMMLSELDDNQNNDPVPLSSSIQMYRSLSHEQYNIVGYFFEYLYLYSKYTPLIILNTDFLERQSKSLQRIAGREDIPDGLIMAEFSLCCNRCNKFPPTKQFQKKTVSETGVTKYHTTMGNQSILYDPVTSEILCGAIQGTTKKRNTPHARRREQRQWEIMNGIVPADIEDDFVKIRSVKANSDISMLRVAHQRQMEGRIPYCLRSTTLSVNLVGILLQANVTKNPKEKKKKAQKVAFDKTKSTSKLRVTPINKATMLDVSKPPYFITPCCGLICGYTFSAWGANGYTCGACLPKSNYEKAHFTEILCMACASVLPNRPSFNYCVQTTCPAYQNPKKRTMCKHGASPYLMMDDIYENKIRYLYICDECLRAFKLLISTNILPLSSIKSKSTAMLTQIL
jgi:hypothetical protein